MAFVKFCEFKITDPAGFFELSHNKESQFNYEVYLKGDTQGVDTPVIADIMQDGVLTLDDYAVAQDVDYDFYVDFYTLGSEITGTDNDFDFTPSGAEVSTIDVSTLTGLLRSLTAAHCRLTTIEGITSLASLATLNVSNNSMTSAQVNAIVDDVFEYAIKVGKSNGTFNITGNDSPIGDSLLAYNALVGFGWNSGTPITEISNRFELEAIGLLLNGNFNQTDNINLGGAGAVWLDTDGTTVVSAPVVGGSLDVTACNNYYTDAVISGIFTGSYNGNGYEITNMAIKQQTDVEKYCGLFEQGSNCQITKLTVSGNMQAYGASASGYSGGVIGYITGSSATIDKSVSNVNCLSGQRVGGFVGYNTSSATITDCYSTGAVSSSGMYAGGFVGYNRTSATITDCYSTGAVSSSSNYAGGFVGINQTSTIADCYSTGNVDSSGNYAGGFIGHNTSATITDCYSTGAVSSSGMYAGGFVGLNQTSTITTSFFYGEISGTSTTRGAFAGRNTTSDILDCYYRGDYYAVDFPAIRTDETGETNTVDITPLTEAEFKDQNSPLSNFNWLDFEMLPNADYPTLKWETNPDYDRTKLKDIYEVQALRHALSLQAELTNNIDAAVTETWNDGAGFVPIGDSTAPFTGTFDGKGYKIDGLYISRPSNNNMGLFGSMSGIVINVACENISIVGGYVLGAIAGLSTGTIKNVYSSGIITGLSDNIRRGGIVGQINSPAVLENFYSDCIITGTAGTIGACIGRNGSVGTIRYGHAANTNLPIVGETVTAINYTSCYQLTKHTDYAAGTTYAIHALVNNPATGQTFRSAQADNTGNALTDTDWWLPTGIQTLTEAEFRNKTSFVGFDFAEVWTTGQPVGIRAKYSESNTYNTVGYPLLRVFETITRPRLRKRFYK